MNFRDIENIWSQDLSTLSNADRGKVYYERAKQVVAESLSDGKKRAKAVDGQRFRRSYLIEAIGCGASAVTQNPKIRSLIAQTDKQLADACQSSQAMDLKTPAENIRKVTPARSLISSLQNESQVLEHQIATSKFESEGKQQVDPYMRQATTGYLRTTETNLDLGLIVSTDSSCRINDQAWEEIPTLIWPEGIDEAASDWLRTLVVEYGIAVSSAREYAKIMRPFLRFCRERRRSWQSVDDSFLIVWREHIHRSLKVDDSRVITSLKTVFSFFRWAEETKRIRFHVGIYAADEIPPALRDVKFPISAKRSFTKGRHGRVYGNWTTTLSLSSQKVTSRIRHTPTEEQIRDLHESTVERLQGERDSLMLSWAEETGARRSEFLRVGKFHMPTSDMVADLIERDEPYIIHVKRKGGKTKPLNVPIDLIIRTQDFIEFTRLEIVDECRRKFVGYIEPDEVFISSTTGLKLHPDSVTSIGRREFLRVGIKNANIHRLRARFAARVIETLVDALFDSQIVGPESSWIETILVKAAEIMGHADPRSLRPYLTYVLNRRLKTADASKAERLSTKLRQLRLHEGTLVRRLNQQKDLHNIAVHLQAGRNGEAAAELRRLADELS